MAPILRTAAAAAPARAVAAGTGCLRHPSYLLASCDSCRAAQAARLTSR